MRGWLWTLCVLKHFRNDHEKNNSSFLKEMFYHLIFMARQVVLKRYFLDHGRGKRHDSFSPVTFFEKCFHWSVIRVCSFSVVKNKVMQIFRIPRTYHGSLQKIFQNPLKKSFISKNEVLFPYFNLILNFIFENLNVFDFS